MTISRLNEVSWLEYSLYCLFMIGQRKQYFTVAENHKYKETGAVYNPYTTVVSEFSFFEGNPVRKEIYILENTSIYR